MLRPLVMDFPSDATAREVGDAFLFGPALLVVAGHDLPGAHPAACTCPKGTWYDFWTGAAVEGGRTIDAAAPFDRIPVHVRAGSIVPLGPDLQYTGERAADPITLRVYAGAERALHALRGRRPDLRLRAGPVQPDPDHVGRRDGAR